MRTEKMRRGPFRHTGVDGAPEGALQGGLETLFCMHFQIRKHIFLCAVCVGGTGITSGPLVLTKKECVNTTRMGL
jgi:hypothetical protein